MARVHIAMAEPVPRLQKLSARSFQTLEIQRRYFVLLVQELVVVVVVVVVIARRKKYYEV